MSSYPLTAVGLFTTHFRFAVFYKIPPGTGRPRCLPCSRIYDPALFHGGITEHPAGDAAVCVRKEHKWR